MSEKSVTVQAIVETLGLIAPLSLAESWDNVGLLLGDLGAEVKSLMTCLTVSESTVAEALSKKVNLIVSHHPIPFRPLSKIVTSDPTGKWIWMLANSGVSVYSPHTAWDNARNGINQQLAEIVGLQSIEPLVPKNIAPVDGPLLAGSGRVGATSHPMTVEAIVDRLRKAIGLSQVNCAAAANGSITKLAIVCGSGGSMLNEVARAGCDGFLTGEATYHQSLEALHLGINMIQIGHHSSERFAMDHLAEKLQLAFPQVQCWGSQQEFDPVDPLK